MVEFYKKFLSRPTWGLSIHNDARILKVVEIFRTRVKPIQSCLEIGVGSGNIAGRVSNDIPLYISTDLAKYNGFDVSMSSKDSIFISCDAAHLVFRDATFDCAILSEVLEHLRKEDQLRALIEIERVLNPNGMLLLSTPNSVSLWARLPKCLPIRKPIEKASQPTENWVTPRVLDSLLTRAGFEIAYRSGSYYLPDMCPMPKTIVRYTSNLLDRFFCSVLRNMGLYQYRLAVSRKDPEYLSLALIESND